MELEYVHLIMSQVYCFPLHRGSCSCTGPMAVDKDEGTDCNVEIFIKGTQVWSMKTLLKYGSKALQQGTNI